MDATQTMPSKPSIFKRGLALSLKVLVWSFVAFLLVFVTTCIIEFNPKLRRKLYGPDHLASFTLDPERVTLKVELTNDSPIGKAEFERRLIVVAPDRSEVATDLAYDHGGFSEANLYRTVDGNLILAGAFDAELITLSPIGIQPHNESYLGNRDVGLYGKADLRDKPYKKDNRRRLGDLVESNYFNHIFYLGVFKFKESRSTDGRRNWSWSFVPAHEEEEFIRDPGG